jgi:hypothetical protein
MLHLDLRLAHRVHGAQEAGGRALVVVKVNLAGPRSNGPGDCSVWNTLMSGATCAVIPDTAPRI